MNEDSYEPAGHSAPRNGGRFSSRQKMRASGRNGKGRPRGKIIDFWTAAEILARRWHWPIVCSIIAAGTFFTLAWLYVQPKFTAVAELLRYETPGTSDFLKTQPLTAQTFSELLAAPDLKRVVGENSKPPMSQDEVSKRLKVDPIDESDIVRVYLTASTPLEAVALANLYGQE